jgi:uncharacterized repeat protein (TIGR02543 family)
MKHLYLSILACCCFCLSATAQRVYINPGHGDWGPNSRPMATVKSVDGQTVISQAGDSLGFFESNTNLWKAFALQEKLKAAGYDVMMSRTQNGPTYPYDKETDQERFDKPLADICAEVNYYGADYFISIHSNANVDGDNVNFPLFIHSGYDGAGFQDERNMALRAWPRHFEAFGKDKDDTNITHGFEPNSAYAADESNVRGSLSFYGYLLGALNHNYQGYLVEGYFHTYQPARHRALNPEWCRQEGIRYFRGIQDYYKKSGEQVGYIMGCVRSLTEMFTHEYYNPMPGTYDEFKPINDAKVVLRDEQDNVIPTECYRHVARHITDQYYYTTDHNYNGIFVFENLDPGEYTLTVHADGYKDKEIEVTVTANATVYPEIFLEQGQGTEPQINVDVKWVLNGGKVDGTLPSKIEGSAYTLPTPTRAGYIFQGWYNNAEGTGTALTTLSVGYKGTVYALWQSTSVRWELNGGVVYPDNQWLWDDFQNYFNEYYGTSKELQPITNVLDFWTENFDISWKMLVESTEYKNSDYWWLGHYLWGAYNGANGTSEYWWRNSLAHFFNNVDSRVWREFAKGKAADSRFYTPINLPNQITYTYTIPTPEKEGYNFLGWYDANNTSGNKLTTLSAGYNGTVYAIWEKAPVTTVTWELNGGHVYPSNDWLWQDFCNVFNEIHSYELNNPLDENAFLAIWTNSFNNVSGKQAYYMLIESTNPTNKRYCWLGDYLWKKTETAAGGNSSYINLSNEWWGKVIWAFFNCTTYTYDTSDKKTISVDFSVAGQPKSWRKFAIDNKDTKNISTDFYTEIILPTTIATDYTIPTPEKEGVTFQGWYNNPKGEGDPIIELKAGSAGTIYAIWQEPVPCIVAYDLNCKYLTGKMAFEFSFYANTQPTAGKLIFYNMNEEPIGEYPINYLWQGKNTVVLNAEDIPALSEQLKIGRDFLWEVHLEARPSTLFAEIFRSESFHTAYATIDNSPASDFFGSIWVANQQKHGYSNGEISGGIWRLVPEQGYARDGGAFAGGHRPHRPRPRPRAPKPNGGGGQPPQWDGQQPPQGGQQPPQGGGQQPPQGGKQEPPRGGRPDHTPSENTDAGFEVIFRPTVAPDGTVYLTDNGKSYGGVFVMDPHTKEITNFFDGCTYEYGEWKDNNGNVVGSGSTGAHIYWAEDGDNKNGFQPDTSKLFLMHNDHAANATRSIGSTKGFFVYDLMGTNPSPQRTNLKHFASEEDYKNKNITEYKNDSVTDYAIVGTSRGAWVCQLRNEDKNVISDPSLTFYPNEGNPTIFTKSLDGGIFGDNELIHGSFGSAIAVNKTENLLAMVGGTGNIMLFDIEWSENTPTLTNKRDYPIVTDDGVNVSGWDLPTITTLNFDYAGNLVATLGETYNDASDKHQVVIFTLPKTPNHINVPSRYSQRVPSLVEDDQCNSIAEEDRTYETVEVSRKMQAGMFNTICLPFAIDLTTLPEDHPYYNATVVEFVGTERIQSGKEEMLQLNFRKLTFQDGDVMQAGMPYLIQPTKDITNPYYFSNVQTGDNVEGLSVTPANSEATFQGITSPTDLDASLPIVFLVDQNRLAISTTSGQMLGNRAYFTLLDSQNIPKRSVISIVKAPTNNHNLYINTTPTSYKIMEDGHIWIIRGGEKYNLMGAKVK